MFRTVLVFMIIGSGSLLADTNFTKVEEVKVSQCCPTGRSIRKRIITENGTETAEPYYCWQSKTNISSSVALTCDGQLYIFTSREYNFSMNSNGKLVLKFNYDTEFQYQPPEVTYQPGEFCIGNHDKVVIYCEKFVERTIDTDVNAWGMVVSCALLVVTAAIYTALPELRDLLGKSIINFCLSLGIGLGILAAINLVEYEHMGLCAARGHLTYFFLIASFFWMNAISIQILLGVRRPMKSNYGWREFIYYATYAWGCPVILSSAMAIVNHTPGEHLKPGIGLNHCWFFNNRMQWYWMYSVMSILIAVNILIFIYISATLWRQSFSSNHIRALKYKFAMTFRMSVVMGVAWAFEMLGSLTEAHIIWEILDLVNSLQGLIIFLVLVVFRRKVIKSMHRHGWLECVSGPVERYLAVGEDEEDVVEHTIGVTLDDTKNNIIRQ